MQAEHGALPKVAAFRLCKQKRCIDRGQQCENNTDRLDISEQRVASEIICDDPNSEQSRRKS